MHSNHRTMSIALAVTVMVSACGSGEPAGSAGQPSPPPDYPPGPYGVGVGDVIDNLALFDLEGRAYDLEATHKGPAKVALLYITATWCFTCGPEIDWLNGRLPASDGDITALAVVVQNPRYEPAQGADGIAFRDAYGVRFETVVDTDDVTGPYRSFAAIPLNIIVRTADMKITYRAEGFDEAALEQALRGVLEAP